MHKEIKKSRLTDYFFISYLNGLELHKINFSKSYKFEQKSIKFPSIIIFVIIKKMDLDLIDQKLHELILY